MSVFGGMFLTSKGRVLQTKAQTGVTLNFTRMAVGDGELGSSIIIDLNSLKNEIKSLDIIKLRVMTEGKAVVGSVLSNQDLVSGFYFREIGVFAEDPDEGEILYCYGNAGENAEYIPAAGGADVIEKVINIITIIGDVENVSANIDESLAYVTVPVFNNHVENSSAHHSRYTNEEVMDVVNTLLQSGSNIDKEYDDENARLIISVVDGEESGLDADLLDGVDGSHYVRRDTEYPHSFTGSGYQKLPSGLILQWGAASLFSGNSSGSITFPITFPNSCFSAFFQDTGSGTTLWADWKMLAVGTNGFDFVSHARDGTQAYSFAWLAIGH